MGLLDLRNSIMAQLDAGKSRDEIFAEGVQRYPGDVGKIAFAIASVPKPELRKKYLTANGVLFLILLAIGVTTLLGELPINLENTTLFIVLRICTPLVLAYFVYHFHGGIYRILGFWCLFDLTEHVLLGRFDTVVGAIKLMLLFLAVILAFWIGLKVFANLRFLGPKQDNLGRYLL